MEQTAGFPLSLNSTTRIVIRRLEEEASIVSTAAAVSASSSSSASPEEWTLRVRVPEWAQAGRRNNVVTVNGASVPSDVIVPGQYLNLRRRWAHGDVVEVCAYTLLLRELRRVRTIPPREPCCPE